MLRAGQKQREAVARVLEGETYRQAADAVGLSRSAVAGACRRAGVKVGFRPASSECIREASRRMWNDPVRGPQLREQMSARTKDRWRQRRRSLREIEAVYA